jgi:hypothetical protein
VIEVSESSPVRPRAPVRLSIIALVRVLQIAVANIIKFEFAAGFEFMLT